MIIGILFKEKKKTNKPCVFFCTSFLYCSATAVLKRGISEKWTLTVLLWGNCADSCLQWKIWEQKKLLNF